MKKEFLAGAGFLIGIALMFFLVIFGKLYTKLEYIRKNSNPNGTWDAAEYYPLNDKDALDKEAEQEWNLFRAAEQKILTVEEKVENAATTAFRYRMPFILMKKGTDKMLGLDMTASLNAGKNDLNDASDLVVPYADDSLGWACDDTDISQNLESLIQFGKQMEDEGRNFLFFENPEKYQGSAAYPDHSEEKYDQIQEAFDENGLDIISAQDLAEAYLRQNPSADPGVGSGYDLTEMFYRTDHHWTTASGIWADGILCNYLNEEYGYAIDPSIYEPDHYEVITYDGEMIGSLGRKVTEVYAPAEPFRIYQPTYETDLDVFISGKNKTFSGTIQDIFFHYDQLEEKNPYFANCYAFTGGDEALIQTHNKRLSDGKRILMIKTSFADCMIPYLAASVEDMDVVDLRYFNGSLQALIEETDPDTVIVQYGMAVFFGDDPFDFR